MSLFDRVLILFFLMASLSYALKPQRNVYDNKEDLRTEIDNIYLNAQDANFTVYYSSPSVRDLRENHIALLKNGSVASIMFRIGDKIYYVTGRE